MPGAMLFFVPSHDGAKVELNLTLCDHFGVRALQDDIMAMFTKSCLTGRIARLNAMIADGAIFQAVETLRGGRQCAALQSCDNWEECGEAHYALWAQVQSALTDSNSTH